MSRNLCLMNRGPRPGCGATCSYQFSPETMSSRPSRLMSATVTASQQPRSSVCLRKAMASSPDISEPRSITGPRSGSFPGSRTGCEAWRPKASPSAPSSAAAGTPALIDLRNFRLPDLLAELMATPSVRIGLAEARCRLHSSVLAPFQSFVEMLPQESCAVRSRPAPAVLALNGLGGTATRNHVYRHQQNPNPRE